MLVAGNRVLGKADELLRGRLWAGGPAPGIWPLVGIVALFGPVYGAAMGAHGGAAAQMAYSAVKVPMLLLLTFLLSLPSFWVLNALLGLAGDFGQAVRALIATQACLGIVLAALAPFTLFWYASFSDYQDAILFNAAMFAIASVSAQIALVRYYQPLENRSARHRHLRRLWIVIYAFVGIQMGWVLRPFVGAPGAPAQFFRAESWSNAYVLVAHLVAHAAGR